MGKKKAGKGIQPELTNADAKAPAAPPAPEKPAAEEKPGAHRQWNGSDWILFKKKQPRLVCADDCPGCA